jgi:hypothetical protein
MKRLVLVILVLGAIAVTIIATASFVAAVPPGKDMAVVDLTEKTMLMRTALLGKYIFVHDDQKMAQGEPCFFVYEYSQDQAGQPEARPDKLVASFHCEPIARAKARQLVTTFQMGSGGNLELREVQFAGTTEGHRVP